MPDYARDLELPQRKQRGWVHEVEVPMAKGDAIAYETAHEGPAGVVEFNIHSHQGRDVTYHVKGTDPRMAGAFTAPWDGKFYLMWENVSHAPVRLRIRATRR